MMFAVTLFLRLRGTWISRFSNWDASSSNWIHPL